MKILYLYFFCNYDIFTVAYAFVYKLFNGSGVLHARLEHDINDLDSNFPYMVEDGIASQWKNYCFKWFFRNIDVLGVIDYEDFRLLKGCQTIWDLTKDVVKVQLNGFRYFNSKGVRSFDEKEDVILLCGRLFSKQKGVDILFQALKHVDLKNWKVKLTGVIDEAIEKMIKSANAQHNNQIEYVGNIADKMDYYEVLNRSKVYCLPSRNDGIPIVIPEAMGYGNVLVSTRLSGTELITDSGSIGYLFDKGDFMQLADIIQGIIDNPTLLRERAFECIERTKKICLWRNIASNLELERFL